MLGAAKTLSKLSAIKDEAVSSAYNRHLQNLQHSQEDRWQKLNIALAQGEIPVGRQH